MTFLVLVGVFPTLGSAEEPDDQCPQDTTYTYIEHGYDFQVGEFCLDAHGNDIMKATPDPQRCPEGTRLASKLKGEGYGVEYCVRADGVKHGMSIGSEEFPDVHIVSETMYVDGVEQGSTADYDRCGNLTSSGSYKDGKRDGLWEFWSYAYDDSTDDECDLEVSVPPDNLEDDEDEDDEDDEDEEVDWNAVAEKNRQPFARGEHRAGTPIGLWTLIAGGTQHEFDFTELTFPADAWQVGNRWVYHVKREFGATRYFVTWEVTERTQQDDTLRVVVKETGGPAEPFEREVVWRVSAGCADRLNATTEEVLEHQCLRDWDLPLEWYGEPDYGISIDTLSLTYSFVYPNANYSGLVMSPEFGALTYVTRDAQERRLDYEIVGFQFGELTSGEYDLVPRACEWEKTRWAKGTESTLALSGKHGASKFIVTTASDLTTFGLYDADGGVVYTATEALPFKLAKVTQAPDGASEVVLVHLASDEAERMLLLELANGTVRSQVLEESSDPKRKLESQFVVDEQTCVVRIVSRGEKDTRVVNFDFSAAGVEKRKR